MFLGQRGEGSGRRSWNGEDPHGKGGSVHTTPADSSNGTSSGQWPVSKPCASRDGGLAPVVVVLGGRVPTIQGEAGCMVLVKLGKHDNKLLQRLVFAWRSQYYGLGQQDSTAFRSREHSYHTTTVSYKAILLRRNSKCLLSRVKDRSLEVSSISLPSTSGLASVLV